MLDWNRLGIRGRGLMGGHCPRLRLEQVRKTTQNVSRAGVPVEIRRGHLPSTSVVWLMGINQLVTGPSHHCVMERFVRL